MFYQKARDPYSYLSHFLGIFFSSIGLIVLVFISKRWNFTLENFLSIFVYGISLIALYSASSIYHFSTKKDKTIEKLRKLDHSMIFVLIAGSYTPIVVGCFTKPYGYYFLFIIWLITLVGIILKIFWVNMPRCLSTILYIFQGSAILFNLSSLSSIPRVSLSLIILSGIFYIIGAFIYMIKKPNYSKNIGFHEIFHIFVLFGSAFHYFAVIYIFI